MAQGKTKIDQVLDKLLAHDRQFGQINQRFEVIDKRFDDVQTTLDKIVNELERAREDRILAVAKDREQDHRLDDLDNRIKVFENTGV